MNEASQIARYIAKQTGRTIKVRDASYLASFNFPLERKLEVIKRVIDLGRAGSIYSALYFRIAFVEEEVSFHKGPIPKKDSSFSSVSDILSSSPTT